MTVIRLNAGNDRNGNPRRLYVAIAPGGNISGVWNEGHNGWSAVPENLRAEASLAPMFNTTPREYRNLLKNFGK